MESIRIFDIDTQYLIEIDKVYPIGNLGTRTETWSWEVTIVKRKYVYKGMAIERSKNVRIPWTQLNENTVDNEMIQLCKDNMS